MASLRMIDTASEAYAQAVAEGDTAKVEKIAAWLESALLGASDRDCEWHSGWAPLPRKMKKSTRQLKELAV